MNEKIFDVTCCENRVNGDEDHVGSVRAKDEEEALEEAYQSFECGAHQHLYVTVAPHARGARLESGTGA